MTVIEFFDNTAIENMIGCIAVHPEKIILIGEGKNMKHQCIAYQYFANNRNMNTKIEYRNVKKSNLIEVINVLTDIVNNEKDCIFDITGGEDIILVAMGTVYQKYFNIKNIRMCKFDIYSSKMINFTNQGQIVSTVEPLFSVKIKLNCITEL